MTESNQLILDRLSKTDSLYLKRGEFTCASKNEKNKKATDFLALYRVDEITFEDKAPRKEALENVISSMNIKDVNFVYLILGNTDGVNFYYGVVADDSVDNYDLAVHDIGTMILKPSLQGNFRGSKITELNPEEKKGVLERIEQLKKMKIMEGVPGINKDDESFQSVDRLIDVMLGDTFGLMLIAKPIALNEINDIQEKMYTLYNVLSPISKSSIQESSGVNKGTSVSHTDGTSESSGENKSVSNQEGTGTSKSHTDGETSGTNKQTTKGTNKEETSNNNKTTTTISGTEGSHEDKNSSDTTQTSTNKSKSKTEGTSTTTGTSTSESKSTQSGSNKGSATTMEIVDKKIQEWIKYMDDIILPRVDYGMGKGMFISSVVLLGCEEASLIKLENTVRSVYGGESGNRMPLKAFNVNMNEASYFKRMQIPKLQFNYELHDDEICVRTGCSQLLCGKTEMWLGNWMSSKELSLIAGLPQKEVVGLALREEVEFGLNINKNEESSILIGHLVQSGAVLAGQDGGPCIPVNYDKKYFDKHIFVTGVTGSGKTTTCQKLLLESEENFLVIEPAKTEYRVLATNRYEDMLVFTLGKETGCPFRLNPFEFFEGENITSRVDMIKASMEAAFDMEAAIPQLLETAIYECYEDKGWDISTNRNHKFNDPYADGVDSFPTLGELEKKIDKVVTEQGFGDRLRDEYIGSIRARLKGLTVGAKGMMLNTPRSIDFVELLDRKVVLELENIKSASEKSLVMGFILANLSEAIRVKYNKTQKQIEHITLIEEAHRLLSKYMPGDSMNKKQGVEMFSDMLAEVRKYGESFIIVDQIPNKLTPEVLKNTNTKIVHKIFAQDDKEAIGNTMALKDEQKEHLSYLASGRAIMMYPGLSKAIQVQILQSEENDTNRVPPDDMKLRDIILDYYCSVYKKGILPGLEKLGEQPDRDVVRLYLDEMHPRSAFVMEYKLLVHRKILNKNLVDTVVNLSRKYDVKRMAQIICHLCHRKESVKEYPDIELYIVELLEEVIAKGTLFDVKKTTGYDFLEGSLIL